MSAAIRAWLSASIALVLLSTWCAAQSAEGDSSPNATDDKHALVQRVLDSTWREASAMVAEVKEAELHFIGSYSTATEKPDTQSLRESATATLKKRYGIEVVNDADTLLCIRIHTNRVLFSRGARRDVPVDGILIEARLLRRGYVIYDGDVYPVIGTLAAYNTVFLSEEATNYNYHTAMPNVLQWLFQPFSAATCAQETWRPFDFDTVPENPDQLERLTLSDAQVGFDVAMLTHNIAQLDVELGNSNNCPSWAPQLCNVTENPFRKHPALRVGDVTIDDLGTPALTLDDIGVDATWARAELKTALNDIDAQSTSGPILNYELKATKPRTVSGIRAWLLGSGYNICEPNVLFEEGDGFVRAPAYIYTRFNMTFTMVGQFAPDYQAAMQRDMANLKRALTSDWLWSPDDYQSDEIADRPDDAPAGAAVLPPLDPVDDKLLIGIINHLRARQLTELPDALLRDMAEIIAVEIDEPLIKSQIDERWWEQTDDGPRLKLWFVDNLKWSERRSDDVKQAADYAIDRIRDRDPLLYNAFDGMFSMQGPSIYAKLPPGYVERLLGPREVGPSQLMKERLVTVQGVFWDASDRVSPARARQALRDLVHAHDDELRNVHIIEAVYAAPAGSRALGATRYFWYERRPELADELLSLCRNEQRVCSNLARMPVSSAPPTLTLAEQMKIDSADN